MKSAEEMAREVLERRDAYNVHRKRRRTLAGKALVCTGALAVVLCTGIGVLQAGNETSDSAQMVVTLSTLENLEDGAYDKMESDETHDTATEDKSDACTEPGKPAERDITMGSELQAALQVYTGQDVLFAVEITIYDGNGTAAETIRTEMSADEVEGYEPAEGRSAVLELAG